MGVLIVAQTTAATSDSFAINESAPRTIIAFGLAGTETCQLQVDRGDGTFQDATAGAVTLTATTKELIITGRGRYRVVKPVTVGAAGVGFW